MRKSVSYLAGVYLVLAYVSLAMQQPIELVDRYFLGYDFNDFFLASAAWLAGENPYSVGRFVTPPLSLLPGIALQPLGFELARGVYLAINAALIAVSLALLWRRFRPAESGLGVLLLFAFAGFPVQMLIERGNIDGVVLALLVGVFVAERAWVIGLCFVLAVWMKIYPIVLLPFLVFRHGPRILPYIGVPFLALVVIWWTELQQYIPNLLNRGGRGGFEENLSPHGLFLALRAGFANQFDIDMPALIGKSFYAFAVPYLLANVYFDWRLARMGQLLPHADMFGAAYLPAMLFFPQLVFPYSGVVLLLLFVVLIGYAASHLRPWQQSALPWAQVAVMFPASGYAVVTGVPLFHAIPQIGVFAIAALAICVKYRLWQEATQTALRPTA